MKIISISNLKGGTGKSTISANIIVALSKDFKVLAIDSDNPQYTLSNYFKNRSDSENSFDSIKLDSIEKLDDIIAKNKNVDYIIIDSPGGSTDIAKKILEISDILITPVSDSRLDLDVIGQPTDNDNKFTPGCFANMIWDARKSRLIKKQSALKWIIIPNKLNVRITNNQRQIMKLLKKMSLLLGFELSPGIKDRVIFKELFSDGRTIFDLKKTELNLSRISAKNEIRMIVNKL